ncbi:type I-C CRISPR-associated protein Cas8c/Csd1 [Pelagicoccus sp. SDUM812003]|uniref:type I-C CRISPR-associated protein Cas8c/Csd1 n=1 Tax=Pelagicoccus sp. SDUM812003 TaxID=3041267 RepID=UPI00280DE8FE|nr:type I-C CRISPR-associated protein Cas8c/Csd1 [Pelagicoccus sp. SDUM812003]MDQ8201754.1 type I-C CRISPR-associated protein Cas8c/Csd1 [Pelagicoccus sp. SDUM812003]
MIFPALYRFAQAKGLLEELDFTEQTLRAVIDLKPDGSYIGTFPVGTKNDPIKKPVSKIPARNSAAIACLGADTANRVVPNLDPEANKFAIATQNLFLEQLKSLAADKPHSGIQAVVNFLAQLAKDTDIQQAIKDAFESEKLKPSDWITFRVEGFPGYLIEWDELKDWWKEKSKHAEEERHASKKDEFVPCMVTGKLCSPLLTHGTRIKVAPGGLAGGVALVSSDKPAFGSYGFSKALVSPMSEEAVEGYVRAINYLGDKKNKDRHYRTSDTIYLFWCDQAEVELNPAKAIEEGDSSKAESDEEWFISAAEAQPKIENLSDSAKTAVGVFNSPNSGMEKKGAELAAARFYCLALSGSSARGVIRNWIDQPLQEAVRNTRHWFEDIEIQLDRNLYDPRDKKKDVKKRPIVAAVGDRKSNWPLWQLVSTLEGKGESSPELARYRTQLFTCALRGRGHPVPIELLMTACRRISTTGDCTPARAALIKLLLTRNHYQKSKIKPTMPEINNRLQKSPAFLSGRLLRVLDGIQRKALGERNASVIDKYYSSASATPSAVLGGLVAKAQPHLSKIRKDQGGLAHWFESQLAEIVDGIVENEGLKATHSPDEQGEFALGFYYQRVLAMKQKPEVDVTDLQED